MVLLLLRLGDGLLLALLLIYSIITATEILLFSVLFVKQSYRFYHTYSDLVPYQDNL